MKAIRFHSIGGPEVLKLEEVETPRPREGQVLARIHVAGVNFADTLYRRGAYAAQPHLPDTPGFEASGVVIEAGPGVEPSWVGRHVAWMGERCYSEYAAVPVTQLIPLPDAVGFEEGAAFPVQSLTAYHLLYTMDRVKPGMTVLVHAAAGGVGLQVIQMAKRAGARVFGTVSTEAKAKLAREYGADEVIQYTREDFAERLKALTGGRGVDLVLDSVGKETFSGNLRALAPLGHLVIFGVASGPPHKLNVMGTLFQKSQKVSAFWLYTLSQVPDVAERAIRQVVEWIAAGELKLPVGLKLPLAQAAEAHRSMEARETVGKILLLVD